MAKTNKQVVTCRNDGPVHHITVSFQGHVPHWKPFGEGHAQVEFTTHDSAGWISLDAQEWSKDGKASKRTMLTLDEGSGRKLYERMKAMYEPAPVVAQ